MAGQAGLDEAHPRHSVFHSGEGQALGGRRLPGRQGVDLQGRIRVELGKGLQITLGMTGGHPAGMACRVALYPAPGQPLAGAANGGKPELIGCLLAEDQAGLVAIEADLQPVLLA